MQHSQLASAVENLNNIFSVPEMVADTPLMIKQAELEGQHKLMNLECSWNDLMYDQSHMGSKNTHNMNLI
ncbi:unnamed protein product [Coregonus sp. 'balchen']|nr:unnamed protein product [Coregonus sp. 'balchen']